MRRILDAFGEEAADHRLAVVAQHAERLLGDAPCRRIEAGAAVERGDALRALGTRRPARRIDRAHQGLARRLFLLVRLYGKSCAPQRGHHHAIETSHWELNTP